MPGDRRRIERRKARRDSGLARHGRRGEDLPRCRGRLSRDAWRDRADRRTRRLNWRSSWRRLLPACDP